jgi:kynurenine formamidase
MNKPVAWINEPYAIEAGFDNGDGTYCVLIKRLPLRTETHKDWKPHEKLLYTHPAELTDEEIYRLLADSIWAVGLNTDCLDEQNWADGITVARSILRKAQEK